MTVRVYSMNEYEHLTGAHRSHTVHKSGLIAGHDTPVALQSVCPIKDYLPALINVPSELEQRRDKRREITLFSVKIKRVDED